MKYSKTNKPLVCMQTNSKCYKGTRTMDILGILWHSTGANNPNLKRYVQPDDNANNKQEMLDLIGKNVHGTDWNHAQVQAGLNAWIGKLEDGSITSIQTMPWNYRPWGCGSGPKGSCNTGWIQFEICEDALNDEKYFNEVYKEACELTAYLCEIYNIDPNASVKVNGVDVPTILCHADAHKLGFGSNHGDVNHWFPKFGKSMDTVREDVSKLLKTKIKLDLSNVNLAAANPEEMWKFFKSKGLNDFGVAGLMGNLFAESGLRPTNLQGSYEKKLNMSDAEYTASVDAKIYNNFINDKAGYGLAQWTYWTLKRDLLKYCQDRGKSIGDLKTQMEFLAHQLSTGYKEVWQILKTATSVKQASDAVLLKFERPADQSISVQNKRAAFGQGYYDSYKTVVKATPKTMYRVRKSWQDVKSQKGAYSSLDNAKKCCDEAGNGYYVFDPKGKQIYPTEKTFKPYKVKITANSLNVRAGAGTRFKIKTTVHKNEIYTIIEESNGWGKLKSEIGWISLSYTKKA